MLALIVALFWLAILTPWAVMKFRNSRADKSIDHFHAEHEVLSRQRYSVAPARRLDEAYLYEEQAYEPEHEAARSRPRLTVVQDDDTYSSLESRTSWDEWDRDYDYDQPRTVGSLGPARALTSHRFAAYASAPVAPVEQGARAYESVPTYADPAPRATMRVRRNRIFASLAASAFFSTSVYLVVGLSLVQYVLILSWTGLVLDVAAALYAVSQGYLEAASLLGRRTIREYSPFEDYVDDRYDEVVDEDDAGRVAASHDEGWRRESRRYALG